MSRAPDLEPENLSVLGKAWAARNQDQRQALFLAQRLNIDPALAAVLAGREVDLEQAQDYLEPKLSAMPDPYVLKNMEQACILVQKALKEGQKIAIFGDYDVDGLTATTLMTRALRSVDHEPLTYIPDRFSEGYGPNIPAIHKLHGAGAQMIIFVDCGTAAVEAIAAAKELGLSVIIIDHHQGSSPLPAADALVNPNHMHDSSQLGQLCAAGVVFMFLVALFRLLRKDGYKNLPDLRSALDLVALATVCDVVPLQGLNRIFVSAGLQVIRSWENTGLRALFALSNNADQPNVSTLGFHLGPRLNAGGRIAHASAGLELLLESDPQKAAIMAATLDSLNAERQEIEASVFEQALAQLAARKDQGDPRCIFVAGEDWHEGVIGVVAGRLKELYYRPSFVFSYNGDMAKASARSIAGVDIGALVSAAKQLGLITAGGGHAMAAGLSLKREQMQAFQDFITSKMSEIDSKTLVPRLLYDDIKRIKAVNHQLYTALQRAAPYGQGNAEPRLIIPSASIKSLRAVGQTKEHFALVLQDHSGASIKAMAFRATTTGLATALQRAHKGGTFAFIGKLREDAWAGAQSVQFLLEDISETFATD